MNKTEDPLRNSGRTTRIIAQAVVDCLAKPGEWVTIRDHWDDPRGHGWTCRMVADHLRKLDVPFEHSSFNRLKVIPLCGQ